MKFVKTSDLLPGMRLAKPIYNKNGVLLYDRNTKLTMPGIKNIENFRLIGVYILEPAEPLPVMSREDLTFEQNQTVYLFRLRDVFDAIAGRKEPAALPSMVQDIRSKYGSLDHRVNFNQNLRSPEDFIYKHGISTAILAAMISSRMTMTDLNKNALVCASLLYGFGYRLVSPSILEKGNDLTDGDRSTIQRFLEKGYESLEIYEKEFDFFPQALRLMEYYIFSQNPANEVRSNPELALLASVLTIADNFDLMTAMNLGHEPESEIMAMKHLRADPKKFTPNIVDLLGECIHIVPGAASVDLSNGERGIVLAENPGDYLHPLILSLKDNQIYDLSIPSVAARIQIVDIMKTMDNRVHMDKETLKQFVPDEQLKEVIMRHRAAISEEHFA